MVPAHTSAVPKHALGLLGGSAKGNGYHLIMCHMVWYDEACCTLCPVALPWAILSASPSSNRLDSLYPNVCIKEAPFV